MTRINRFFSRIRVFNCNGKLYSREKQSPDEEPPPEKQSPQCYGCLFLIRATLIFPAPDPNGHGIRIASIANTPYSSGKLGYLRDFRGIELLLAHAIVQVPLLGSLQNFSWLLYLLSADLACKFRFSPEFLNREDSVPVFYFDLHVITERIDKELGEEILCTGGCSDDSVKRLELLADGTGDHQEYEEFRLEEPGEIEAYLKSYPTFDFVEPRGVDEIRAALEVRRFHQEEDDEDEDEVCKEVCPICMESFCEGAVVAETCCSHIFHKNCVYKWLFMHNSCPLCSSSFDIISV